MDIKKLKKAELLEVTQRLIADNNALRSLQDALYRQIEHWKFMAKMGLISDAVLLLALLGAGLILRSYIGS